MEMVDVLTESDAKTESDGEVPQVQHSAMLKLCAMKSSRQMTSPMFNRHACHIVNFAFEPLAVDVAPVVACTCWYLIYCLNSPKEQPHLLVLDLSVYIRRVGKCD